MLQIISSWIFFFYVLFSGGCWGSVFFMVELYQYINAIQHVYFLVTSKIDTVDGENISDAVSHVLLILVLKLLFKWNYQLYLIMSLPGISRFSRTLPRQVSWNHLYESIKHIANVTPEVYAMFCKMLLTMWIFDNVSLLSIIPCLLSLIKL